MSARWILYSKAECELCDIMKAELRALLGERSRDVSVIDIDGDAELETRFGQRVPVLTVDDEIVCVYRINTERVQRWLERTGPR